MVTTVRVGPFAADSAVGSKVAARVFLAEKGSFANDAAALLKAADVDAKTVEPLTVKEGGADLVTIWKKNGDKLVQHVFAQFGNERSRNMGIVRGDSINEAAAKAVPSSGDALVVIAVDSAEHALPAALAVAKLWPIYTHKSAAKKVADRTVYVDFHLKDGSKDAINYDEIQNVAGAMRTVQRLVDMPCSELNTTTYVQEAHDLVKRLNGVEGRLADVKIKVVQGEELDKQGFGGLWGVGKAAEHLPALVHLQYEPSSVSDASKVYALVGKGIVYDTGGLSIKATAGMCGMKVDMGGSAAVFGAFEAAVRSRLPVKLHGILCLAENAVDAKSTKNDDILHMYSGKSVEVNNTDAEGRLVLGDGVAYASKHLKPALIVDIATLTGAQLITTGVKHAGVLTNCEKTEAKVITAGKKSGDLVFPMIYAPEILKSQFESQVADMKNSVKDRMNAQSSCAGHFVEEHLDAEYKNPWLHIDIAGPAHAKDRATGFGVALLYQLVKNF
ncbi:hypothetical protein RI367_004389 [Sorochytrium milnesiophthora]